MRKISLTAALAAATLSTAAMAADWVFMTGNSIGDIFYVDRSSIRTMPSGYKRAWERAHYNEPLSMGATSSRTYKEYDCSEARSRTLQVTAYEGERAMQTFTGGGEWSYITPDGAEEAAFDYVCFGKLPE